MTDSERLKKILEFVEAQSNDPSLWCVCASIHEAYIQMALRRLHARIEGEDVSWLDGGD